MATPTIPNGEEYFFPVIYEGNGGGQRVGKFVPFTDNGTIANSCIFNSADTARMNVDFTSSGTNTKKCTISFWFKLGKSTTATGNLISAWGGTGYLFQIFKYADNHGTYPSSIMFQHYDGGAYNSQIRPNRTFEDRSKWYHLMYVWDSTESTAADRIKIYIDGDQITSFSTSSYPSSNDDFVLTDKQSGDNTTVALGTNASQIGSTENQLYDGYLAEVNVVDGTALTPSTFGVTDTSTMRWIPKTLSGITYGTNGFRLKFQDSSALGDDTSGNTNDFTVANIVASDQTTDSPTQNFPIIDSSRTAMTMTEGNTVGTAPSTGVKFAFTGMTFDPFDSTGYYMEFKLIQHTGCVVGFRLDDETVSTSQSYQNDGYVSLNSVNDWRQDNTITFNGSDVFANNDIVGVYIKDGKVYYSINGTMQNSSNYVSSFKPGRYRITIGHNSNYSPLASAQIILPQSKWNHTPSGDFANYREINQDNLPETAKGISGLVWTKNRDATDSHQLYDSSRGKQEVILPNATTAESTVTDGLQKFLKGGQQIEDNVAINTSGESYVSWNWVANGGTTETNTDGSITSTVQANTTAGFSIVEWTGDGGQSTVGHGLSSTPKIVIQKNLDSTSDWWFYTTAIDGSYDYLKLNSTAAKSDYSATAPTSTVFTSHGWGTTSMIGYCWHEVEGFSKFGSYEGNSNVEGPFISLNFTPSFVMIKNINDGDSFADWSIFDNARSPTNEVTAQLRANLTNAELTSNKIDMLSNGFKLRGTGTRINESGDTFIYMAFAKCPFANISPATAR
ncbi:hypothetical protein [uncultured Mediterranean phage uvMED]|nr:hypothetical protein [uncultured Mediterranean phage uvMED]